jgi:hypothetical protein
METAPSNVPARRPVFRGFDSSIEQLLGADMRLLYGMAVPILMIVGLIIVLALTPATWLVAGIVVLELAALAIVVIALMEMLDEGEDDDSVPG